jgi:hypothetical protein
MKFLIVLFLLIIISCGDKETVLLPKSDLTFLKEVQNHSSIFLFFKTKGKDTLIEVNRKNSISSTNWIFHIDRRLSLRLVVPEIIKLQAKKEASAHKSETSDNYFSYSDSLHKNLAFLSFTKVKYQLTNPKSGAIIYFPKNSFQLQKLKNISGKTVLVFDKNLSFGDYLRYKIAIHKLHLSNVYKEEFVN